MEIRGRYDGAAARRPRSVGASSNPQAQRLAGDIERLAGLVDEWQEAKRSVDEVLTYATERGETHLDAEQAAYVRGMWEWQRRIDADLDALGIPRGEVAEALDQMGQRVDDIAAAEETRAAATRSAVRYGGTAVTSVRVGAEPGIYRADGPHSFFKDLALADGRGDWAARERLARHARAGGLPADEARASSTTNLAGLVPPQFLPDLFAEEARAGGTFIALAQRLSLPAEGMSLTVPLSSTPTIVASQTQDNATISSQDATAVDLTVPVRVIAGFTDVSWQSIERGHLVDRLLFSDLMGAWAEENDRQAIEADGTLGTHFGVLSTTDVATVTVTSQSPLTQWKKVGEAIATLGQNRKRPATAIVMAPRRWGAWTVASDSQGRPLFDTSGDGRNTIAQGDAAAVDGPVGRAHGVPVYTDPNIPLTLSNSVSGNEDAILVTRATDVLQWRDSGPLVVRFDSIGSSTLTARLLIHGYAAFTAGYRPESTLVCSGSGLFTPAFT